MSEQEVLVDAKGVWKRYGVPLAHVARREINRLRPGGAIKNEFPFALQDISFSVSRGETLGIIGRNGVGKSTLLKVVAGVTPPTRGKIDVKGSIFPMIELNAGTHPEFTGRENIYFLGAVMGFTHTEIKRRMDDIEEFCELGEWMDRPVRKYSSGMRARLGFAVALHVDADIMLIDEVLSVGDVSFRNKCIRSMNRLRAKGTATLFVSHNINVVNLFCDKVLLLADGGMVAYGPPHEAVQEYLSLARSEMDNQRAKSGAAVAEQEFTDAVATDDAEILGAEVLDSAGKNHGSLDYGKPGTILIRIHVKKPVDKPWIILYFQTPEPRQNVAFSRIQLNENLSVGEHVIEFSFDHLPLTAGVYYLAVRVRGDHLLIAYASVNDIITLTVKPSPVDPWVSNTVGYMALAGSWRVDGGDLQIKGDDSVNSLAFEKL